jgi:hypothetical protein
MPDSFNKNLAAQRHNDIIREVERIRDSLTNDVINYYYSDPTSEDDEKTKHDGMRKYLQIAQNSIRDLLNGKLY